MYAASIANTIAILAFNKANSANYYTYLVDANTAAAFNKANTSSAVTGGYYAGNGGIKTPDNYGDIFRIHSNTLSQNVTILSGNNAMAVGPITVTGNNILTIQTGSRVVII